MAEPNRPREPSQDRAGPHRPQGSGDSQSKQNSRLLYAEARRRQQVTDRSVFFLMLSDIRVIFLLLLVLSTPDMLGLQVVEPNTKL